MFVEHCISFRNEFDKFNNTGARMLDFFLLKSYFWRENVRVLSYA